MKPFQTQEGMMKTRKQLENSTMANDGMPQGILGVIKDIHGSYALSQ
jgi:hypothetical protein